MKTLKVEEVYVTRCETFNELVTRLPYFIDEIDNKRRMHSPLGYQLPNHFERNLARQAA